MKNCTPDLRCRRLECPTCTWRYAGQIALRIELSRTGGPLLAVEISGFEEFETWRVAVRNLVDHRRRASKGWGNLLTHFWLCHDGVVRGIIGTGSVGMTELVEAVGRRWSIYVRRIEVEELRVRIYRVVQQVACPEGGARYQHVKLAIWPRRERACAASFASSGIEPMPVVL